LEGIKIITVCVYKDTGITDVSFSTFPFISRIRIKLELSRVDQNIHLGMKKG